MKGQIVKQISNDYSVEHNKNITICKVRGKFRNENISPKVGDYVSFDLDKKIIEEILPRKNSLDRPVVSNIDQAMIVTSLKTPDFSTNLLDKLLSICILNDIKPIICVTKVDLVKKDELKKYKRILNYYKKIGYPVVYAKHIRKVKRLLKNKVTVFTGQTGSGKTTILNRLNKNLRLATGEVSKALGRGKHTTRHVELMLINNGKVVDTPGFSAVSFKDFKDEEIRDSFCEWANNPCSYSNCMHLKEKDCVVKQSVLNGKILKSRYENYCNFIEKRNL